jgi:hypothetical protein
VVQALQQGNRVGFPNYWLEDGYLFKERRLCVPNCSLRQQLVLEHHIQGNFGIDKTLGLLQRNYHWHGMKKDVGRLVNSCGVFQRSKRGSSNAGLYLPLPVPSKPQEHVSMDFVMGFPPTSRRSDSIMVVVDWFSKMAHFVACKKVHDASSIVGLYFKDIYKLHGLPSSIVSNRDSKFLAHFWRTLWKKLGTNLNYSTSFHPQTDGQTEVVNRSLGNLLHCLIKENPREWGAILPLAKFSFNASINRTTQSSTFEVVYGLQPAGVADLLSLPLPTKSNLKALDMVQHMQQVHQAVQQKIQMPSIKLELTKEGDNFSLKKVIWCGFTCLRKDNWVDPTLSFKTERLGLARFFKSSMTMHTKWSCHPIYKLQTPSMFDTWFHMFMVEFLQLNLEAKFSRKEGLMPIVLHFIPFLFYCFVMLLLLFLKILLCCYGHLCT